MRQSSVVKALLEKERNQTLAKSIISGIEVRFGEVSDTIKNSLLSIQEEDTLSYLLRQSFVAEKDDVERKIHVLSA